MITPTLPSLDQVKDSALTLPQTGQPSNNLMTFKDTLTHAIELAKLSRNNSSEQFMTPLRGTVAASDFNSILGNLNQATDTYGQDVLKADIAKATPTFKTEQIGDTLYQYQIDDTGKVVGKPSVVQTNPSATSGTKADAKDEENDVAAAVLDFQHKMQASGWAGANPDAYNYYKNQLAQTYGASAALKLDKAMADAGVSVDYTNK